jgi:tripeptidyl-peptidase-1
MYYSGDYGVSHYYPASSAYVTSVGATAVVASNQTLNITSPLPPICNIPGCLCSTSMKEEAAMKSNEARFNTGGGFSTWITMPSYQVEAVEAYLQSGVPLPNQITYNPKNRAYPDIAAVGSNIAFMDGPFPVETTAGTSASCPIIAAMITILNQDRLNVGKKPLGFLNQLLYQMAREVPQTFTDIVVGNNGNGGPETGFEATTGWDPLTGWGTPVVSEIRKYISQLN